jgi:hypothetical protein
LNSCRPKTEWGAESAGACEGLMGLQLGSPEPSISLRWLKFTFKMIFGFLGVVDLNSMKYFGVGNFGAKIIPTNFLVKVAVPEERQRPRSWYRLRLCNV